MLTFIHGFFLFAYLFTANRIVSVKFPLDLLSVFFYCYALLGFSLGLFYQSKLKPFHLKMLCAFIPVFAACMLFNQNVTVHFLIMETYYPYPKPQSIVFYMTLLVFFLLLLPLVPFYLGLKTKFVSSRSLFTFFLCGAAGTLSAHHAILLAGAPFFLSLLLFFIFLKNKPVAAAVLLLGIASLFLIKKNVFFLWRVKDYKILSSHWTPHYKVDFISFNEDRCLGGVHNTLMIWYVCDDMQLLQTEVRHSQQAFVPYARNVLNLGRVDGVNALTLLEQGAKIHAFTSADVDALVEEKVRMSYQKYNKNIFHHPGMESMSGDLRSILKKTNTRYDLVYLDGIGIRLYTYPLSIIPYENYMYTKDSYDTIFQRVLKKDGVLVVDWGSSNLEEVYPLVANLPQDVHFQAYWTTFTNYPMLGLPVFYVIATKSKERLARIRETMQSVSSFKKIKISDRATLYHFNDNRPFVQRGLYFVLLFLSLPLAFSFMFTYFFLSKNSPPFSKKPVFNSPFLKGGHRGISTGIYLGILFSYILSRDTRYFFQGPAFGHLFVHTEFFIFLFAGSFLSRKPYLKWLLLLFPVLVLLHQHGNNETALYFLAPISLIHGSLLHEKENTNPAEFFFGFPLGIYLFQFLLVIGGYWTVTLCLAAGFTCLAMKHFVES